MPEVGLTETPFTQSLKSETKIKDFFEVPKDKILELARGNDEEFIGRGLESVVVGRKEKPEIVIAYNYFGMSPERAKSDFYFQRIMSTLFPHNFPHFYASFSGDNLDSEGHKSGTIRARVKEPLKTIKNRFKDKLGFSNVKYPFSDVMRTLNELNLGAGIFNDETNINFMIGQDGGEYYIDNLEPFMHRINYVDEYTKQPIWDKNRIGNYMKQHGYSDTDISIVSNSIDRLHAILPK